MPYNIHFSCVSHRGNCRNMNQDNLICNGYYMEPENSEIELPISGKFTLKTPILFGVFDGMGGEECGEIASYIAAKKASSIVFKKNSVFDLTEYCKQTNKEICDYAENNLVSTMGTTAAMLLFSKKEITLCNIGDSKIFRFSGGMLEQISKDHIVISSFGTKPLLSQHLGIPPTELLIEPYLSRGRYKSSDKYLICSDGLTDMLSVDEIKAILNIGNPEHITKVLLEKALENGGKDNITLIFLEIRRSPKNIFKIINRYKGARNL